MYYPIWKDTYYSNYFETLDYYLKDMSDESIVHRAYTKRMPGRTGVTLNINNMVDEYLTPAFASDFTQASNEVIPNPEAFKTYQLRGAGDGHLESFRFLYDWSYEDWTGETPHNMSTPVSHLDPRMKAFFTIYNESATTLDWEIEYQPMIRTTDLHFGLAGGSKTAVIEANTDWVIESLPDWISADITAGTGVYSAVTYTSVTFTATPNTGAECRKGKIELNGASINVCQYGELDWQVTPDGINFDASGESESITITSNAGWRITSYPDWVDISQTSGESGVSTVSVTASANTSVTTPRTGGISILSGNESQIIDIYQEHIGPALSFSPSTYVFDYSGGTMQLTINSNVDWYITSYPNWATISALSGDVGSTVVTVTAEESETLRTGVVTFLEGFKCSHLTNWIIKEGYERIDVVPASLTFNPKGGRIQASIISNVPWGIQTIPSWLHTDINEGPSGETAVNIIADANDTENDRSYTLTITGGTTASTQISVSQQTLSWENEYLTFLISRPGIISWDRRRGPNDSNILDIEYRRNGGEWITIPDVDKNTRQPYDIQVNSGDILEFKGVHNTYSYPTNYSTHNFSASTAEFEVCGNILSMIYGDGFREESEFTGSGTAQFYYFFANCTGLTNADNLILLPSTAASECYAFMFLGCTSLETTPELPATTLNRASYQSMFEGCSSLVTPPELPATTVADWCYMDMFKNCSSLTTAPVLSAYTLTPNCYREMFLNCSSLTAITCLAYNKNASNCTKSWVSGVSASGVFTKNPNTFSWDTGVDGIPNNWTVIDA